MIGSIDQTEVLQSVPTVATSGQSAGHWLEVLSHLDPRYGGLSAAVPLLASKLVSGERLRVDVAGFCAPDESMASIQRPGMTLSCWPASRVAWIRDASLPMRFDRIVERVDGLHLHGLWEASTDVAAKAALRAGKPYVVSAHGMLEPWALRNKGLKKRIYAALVERSNLEGAACLHALTLAEAADYRRFGLRNPIAVIPNGVDAPDHIDPNTFLSRFPELTGKQIILFLGRIHFKKGLDILVETWSAIAHRFPDAVLVLFTDMLDEGMKWSALANACCFVLPSYSEGLSVAALEAMSMAVPVILSDNCNLPEVLEAGGGRVIAAETGALTEALEEMLQSTSSSRSGMGERGKALVAQRFSWSMIAGQMAELYAWVETGVRPRSFELLEVPQ